MERNQSFINTAMEALQPVEERAYAPDMMVSALYMIVLAVTTAAAMAFYSFMGTVEKLNQLYWRPRQEVRHLNAAVDNSRRYVLITGCDGGLGNETARRLDHFGFSVIAGCLDINSVGVQQLKRETSEKLTTLQMDVTNMEDVEAAKLWVKENIKGELWGLVNNAGVCLIGTPEIMSQRDIHNILNVNLLGTINVTKAFLPFIRSSQGRIVNIGSINGEVPMPFFSIYNTSKAGVKSFTESIAYELRDWGVKVSLIAPAAFKTGIIKYDRTERANRWWADAGEDTRRDYGKTYFNMELRKSKRMTVSDNFALVTASILDGLTSESPKSVYRVGVGSKLLPALYKYLPSPLRSMLCGIALNFITGCPEALQMKTGN